MILEGESIILGLRKFRENSIIVVFFNRDHGLFSGLLRKANLNVGSIVYIVWKARLIEHLGSLNCDIIEDIMPFIIHDKEKLLVLNVATFTLSKVVPERDRKPELYDALLLFIKKLKSGDNWYGIYIYFELMLLKNIGFGLDLSKCSISNVKNVAFISPKTGKAASEMVGMPYQDKLFRIPKLLFDVYNGNIVEEFTSKEEFLESFKIIDYFLHKFFLIPMDINLDFRKNIFAFSMG